MKGHWVIQNTGTIFLAISVLSLMIPLSNSMWAEAAISDGTVDSFQKISDTEGDFTGVLDDSDLFGFGFSVAGIGDLDGDGIEDIAVGAPESDDGGTNRGEVWILFLGTDGKVDSFQKISDTEGDFTGVLDDSDLFGFGTGVSGIGDLDDDGIVDIAVGAGEDDDGGPNRGAVWILFMGTDGKVDGFQKISSTEGGFTGVLDDSDFFGFSIPAIGDLNGDGIVDIAVGADGDDDGGTNRGAVWILFLNNIDDGTGPPSTPGGGSGNSNPPAEPGPPEETPGKGTPPQNPGPPSGSPGSGNGKGKP